MSEADLDRVHDPLMSPLVWDLAHIAAFEDLWVGRALGEGELHPELGEVYDATETPRAARGELRYLRHDEALAFMDEVRTRTLDRLEEVNPVTQELLVQHEHQHTETMLQTLALAEPGVCAPVRRRRPPREQPAPRGELLFDAQELWLGDAGEGFVYDNERPRHRIELAPFAVDMRPVTSSEYAEFIRAGGYSARSLWSEEGWAARHAGGWERPLYWTDDGRVRSFEQVWPLDPERPVMNVSYFEAEAFARFAGKRLPTEAEWECAARAAGSADSGHLDQLDYDPGPAGPFIGDTWEWTSSEFGGYPGFRPHPYPEYSQPFFGAGYRVLRGASWASRPRLARVTVRNWDLPERRQIFAGLRLARDA